MKKIILAIVVLFFSFQKAHAEPIIDLPPGWGTYEPCPNEIGKYNGTGEELTPVPENSSGGGRVSNPPQNKQGSCICDGMSYEPKEFKEGDTIKITAYAKVTGNSSNTVVKNILFSSGKKNENQIGSEISQVSVPASLVSRTRYSATWDYTVPADLEKGVPYYVWTDIDCSTKALNGQSYSQIVSSESNEIVIKDSLIDKIKNFFSDIFKRDNSQRVQSAPDEKALDQKSEESLQIGTFDVGVKIVNSCRSIKIQKY